MASSALQTMVNGFIMHTITTGRYFMKTTPLTGIMTATGLVPQKKARYPVPWRQAWPNH
jgi:hypothetical protein